MMQILPVIDILDGTIVRAVAGRRDKYRPIVSRLTPHHQPIAVANAMRDAFGLNELYVADLDGILHRRPNHSIHQALIDDGFQLLVDPGIRDAAGLDMVSSAVDLVVALETCRSPGELSLIVERRQRVTFSVDLMNGKLQRPPLTGGISATGSQTIDSEECWSEAPEDCIRQAAGTHVESIIVLDLADVGMGTGGSTEALCRFIHHEFPAMRLITGGGVRNREDLNRLRNLPVNAVLVASALHDGRIGREDLLSLETR
jgi:phosphoribosylformimino-5-aminoimidazole carboxamide ribotide isomerase